MDYLAMGPINGYLDITNIPTNQRKSFRNDNAKVLQESARLAETIAKEMMPLICDWQWRGDDERQPVLESLKERGADLLAAMAGDRGPKALADSLSSISHLCTQQDHHLPWEFLYLGDPSAPVSMDLFFGARAVIGRGIDEESDKDVDRNRPNKLLADKGPLADWSPDIRLPFGYAEDARLKSAQSQAEKAVFSSLGIATAPLTKLSTANNRQSLQRFKEFMADSELLTHFNCHAEASTLKSTGMMYVSDVYQIDELKLDAARPCPSSIVVLNCCDGHTMQHSVEPTLAKLIAPRVQAVVATTARIDDGYATRWAHCFYKALCRGLDVAGSILAARQHLLAEPNPDPSALLYAYLGEPKARLRARLVTP